MLDIIAKLGWKKAAGGALAIALGAVVLASLIGASMELRSLRKQHAADQQLIAGAQFADKVNQATIAGLRALLDQQNSAVAAYQQQTTDAQARAAAAAKQSDAAAAPRAQAVAQLRAAPPVANDCPAPAAHNEVRAQL